jgi:hypothetical protein
MELTCSTMRAKGHLVLVQRSEMHPLQKCPKPGQDDIMFSETNVPVGTTATESEENRVGTLPATPQRALAVRVEILVPTRDPMSTSNLCLRWRTVSR